MLGGRSSACFCAERADTDGGLTASVTVFGGGSGGGRLNGGRRGRGPMGRELAVGGVQRAQETARLTMPSQRPTPGSVGPPLPFPPAEIAWPHRLASHPLPGAKPPSPPVQLVRKERQGAAIGASHSREGR